MSLDSAITVQRNTTATPAQVWSVLANGWAYSTWVVGTARVRAVEPDWPQQGQRIHHSFGTWPALIDDTTEVLESVEPERLRLRARGWPAGEAEVLLTISQSPGGSLIRIEEDVVSGPSALIPKPLRQLAIGPRNTESLRRLAYLAEAHTQDPV